MAGKNGSTRPNVVAKVKGTTEVPSTLDPLAQAREADPLIELGATGLLRTGDRGYIYEEFLRELSGFRARQVYREMRDNDSIIGAIMYAVEMMTRQVVWRVEGDNAKTADFIESCIADMSHTWEDLMAEILSMLTFGYAWHEIVYKVRKGDTDDPTTNSAYKDGKFGWRKIPIRAQETLYEWVFDESGGIQGVVQNAPPAYKFVELPIERSLLFRVGMHKGNPEGRSLLRNSYRSWYMKRRIEEIEAIGIERDLAGLPIIYRDGDLKKLDNELMRILRNTRRGEQEGLMFPLLYDEKGNKKLTFELLSSPGSRQMDVNSVIDRYNKAIAMTVLADFIMLGQSSSSGGSKGGSNALSQNKSELFGKSLEAILHTIAATFNRYAIPKLLKLNNFPTDDAPKIVPGPVYQPNLLELAAFLTAMAGAGASLFPDDDLENFLRNAAYLPEKPENLEQQTAVPSPGTSSVPLAPGQAPQQQASPTIPTALPAPAEPAKPPKAAKPAIPAAKRGRKR